MYNKDIQRQSYHHLHWSLFLGLRELDMRYTDLSSIPPDLLAKVISRMEVLKEDIGSVVSIIPTNQTVVSVIYVNYSKSCEYNPISQKVVVMFSSKIEREQAKALMEALANRSSNLKAC